MLPSIVKFTQQSSGSMVSTSAPRMPLGAFEGQMSTGIVSKAIGAACKLIVSCMCYDVSLFADFNKIIYSI